MRGPRGSWRSVLPLQRCRRWTCKASPQASVMQPDARQCSRRFRQSAGAVWCLRHATQWCASRSLSTARTKGTQLESMTLTRALGPCGSISFNVNTVLWMQLKIDKSAASCERQCYGWVGQEQPIKCPAFFLATPGRPQPHGGATERSIF